MDKDYHYFINTLGDEGKTKLDEKELKEFISLLCDFIHEHPEALQDAGKAGTINV